ARAAEDAPCPVLDWFFSQWVIDGAGHPELHVEIAWDPEHHLASVTVEQQQKTDGKTPVFRLPTRMRFRVADKDIDAPIELIDRKHVFHLRLDTEPTQAI